MTARNAFEGLATESSLNFLQRIALKALSRLTFSMTGLRVDAGGSSVTIASGTVTIASGTVTASNNVALGRATADGQGIQISQVNYNHGFRRNLVIS